MTAGQEQASILAQMSSSVSASSSRRLRGVSPLMLGVGVAAVVIAVALPIAVRGVDGTGGSPAGTVRDFLIGAVVGQERREHAVARESLVICRDPTGSGHGASSSLDGVSRLAVRSSDRANEARGRS